ncbi:MAG: DUF2680 domain-containing protein, partial [Clostridia bacterium]
MTSMKKILFTGAVLVAIGATSITAFAASVYNTPAEAVAGLTGKTVAQVTEERQTTGKTYGTIAKDAGKLDAFKKANLQTKKDILAARVAAGTLTQAKADEIIKALEANQATCDGTGSAKIGQSMGAGFGRGQGRGQGGGQGGGCGLGG